MGWKGLALNAVVTLVVTVVGGVVVFLLTADDSRHKNITYRTERIADFRGQEGALSIHRISVSNKSARSAQNIDLRIQAPTGVRFRDYRISVGNTERPDTYANLISDRNLIVRMPILGISEILEITVALQGETNGSLDFFGRTADQVIVEELSSESGFLGLDNKTVTRYVAIGAMMIALITQAFILNFLRKRTHRLFRLARAISRGTPAFEGEYGNSNDAGFVLFHRGAVAEAKVFFERQLEQRPTPMVFANYALALSFLGERDRSPSYFAGAEWWAEWLEDQHEIAVVKFAKSVHLASVGDIEESKKTMKAALSLSEKEVTHYIRSSVILGDLVSRHPEILPTDFRISSQARGSSAA